MDIGRTTLGIVTAVCVTAGAGGVYLATRGGDGDSRAADAVAVSADPAALAVEQSEAIVADDIDRGAPAATAPPRVERRAAPARPGVERPSAAPDREYRPAPARPQPAAGAIEAAPPAVEAADRAVTPPVEPAFPSEPEPPRAAEPPAPEFVELVVPSDSVIGLQLDTSLTSERARVEDQVVAHVTRDLRVGDRVAIPAGARALGEVTLVERGGRLRERARLGVRFTSVVLADGTRIPLDTEAIYREGDAPGGESAAKIGGGAIGGAIIGGILGGARGAAIGGSIGAGAGTAAVMAGGRNAATLPTGAPVTVRLESPATVTVEK